METAFQQTPVHTVGSMPSLEQSAPECVLVGGDLGEIDLKDYRGQRVILNIFPSVDTGTCAASVRRFNELATQLENTSVLCISADLPFAQQRFCGAEGIDNVVTGSSFRSDFGREWGLQMADGPLQGLLARAVVVLDAEGTVVHSQLVPEITDEPDYDSALSALQ